MRRANCLSVFALLKMRMQIVIFMKRYFDNLHYEKFSDGSVKCIEDEVPFDLPDSWAWERLSNLASFSGGKTPSTSRSEYWDGDILWVTSKDMKSKYITSSQLRLSALGAEQMQMYQPDTLLLVTRSGILRHTLPVAILKECATINQDLKAIILYMPQLAEYIYVCLKGMETQLLLKYTKSGTTVENVNFDEFQKVLLPIPPIQQIDRIMSSTGSAESVVSTIEDDKVALADYVIKAKSKILNLAIRGQLVPQDPADEPASVLLERIRAEKEELIKQGKIKRDKKESVIFRGEDNSYYQKVEADGSVVIQRVDVPPTWAVCCLQEISYPVSTVGMQIKSEEIQKDGVFPVISQGQSFIDGYYSDESKVIYDSPIILFGDHTRNVKYIDFPFVVGADGTKLHKVIRANERYVYYWMCHASQCIADRGYARHYSLLQKECFTLPPIAEQIRIVNCIDQLFAQLDSIADALL